MNHSQLAQAGDRLRAIGDFDGLNSPRPRRPAMAIDGHVPRLSSAVPISDASSPTMRSCVRFAVTFSSVVTVCLHPSCVRSRYRMDIIEAPLAGCSAVRVSSGNAKDSVTRVSLAASIRRREGSPASHTISHWCPTGDAAGGRKVSRRVPPVRSTRYWIAPSERRSR